MEGNARSEEEAHHPERSSGADRGEGAVGAEAAVADAAGGGPGGSASVAGAAVEPPDSGAGERKSIVVGEAGISRFRAHAGGGVLGRAARDRGEPGDPAAVDDGGAVVETADSRPSRWMKGFDLPALKECSPALGRRPVILLSGLPEGQDRE